MNWVWRRLAPFVKTATTIEFTGISEEQLRVILNQEALHRLRWVEAVIFNDEIENEKKIQAIQDEFLKER